MQQAVSNAGVRLNRMVLGWVPVLFGALVLGLVLIGPTWLAARQLDWQRQLLHAQADRLEVQADGYRDALHALADGDPVLLQRLAYHYFALKPAGADVLSTRPAAPWAVNQPLHQPEPIEAWLRQPLPRVGVEVPEPPMARSRLLRIVAGPHRMGVATAGLMMIVGGLIGSGGFKH